MRNDDKNVSRVALVDLALRRFHNTGACTVGEYGGTKHRGGGCEWLGETMSEAFNMDFMRQSC